DVDQLLAVGKLLELGLRALRQRFELGGIEYRECDAVKILVGHGGTSEPMIPIAPLASARGVERGQLLFRQREARGRDVLLQVAHLERTRDREHDRAALEEPGKRNLAFCGALR